MAAILVVVYAAFLAGLAIVTLSFVYCSIFERQRRAALMGGVLLSGLLVGEAALLTLASNGFFETQFGFVLLCTGFVFPVGVFGLWIRTGGNPVALQGTQGYVVGEVRRFDERDHVFSRNRPPSCSADYYREFYDKHPEWEEVDERRRQKGPMGPIGNVDKPHEAPNVAATLCCLSMRRPLGRRDVAKPARDARCESARVPLTRQEATKRTKGFISHLGADLVGITELDPRWVYSNRGDIRDGDPKEWGAEIEPHHKYAIVFAVEMSAEMVAAAPHTASVLETCNIYAKMALMSVETAGFIANLGYSATANHIGYYETLLVPLAVDAGLGEASRLGFLITEPFGPRVRLACVTTDLPLETDRPIDIGVEDFCQVCEKCAVGCPSKSIPLGEPIVVNGIRRWKLNAETCYEQWAKYGTDCNICMRICPWSHARTWPHRLITRMVARNRWSRRLFSPLDDFFYGRIPRPLPPPAWADFRGS